MLPDWLEPSIQKRVDEIVDDNCSNDPEKLFEKFSHTIQAIDGVDKETIFDLENTLILMVKQTTDSAYRSGLSDMAKLTK